VIHRIDVKQEEQKRVKLHIVISIYSIWIVFQQPAFPTLTVQTRDQEQFVQSLPQLGRKRATNQARKLARRAVKMENSAQETGFAKMVGFVIINTAQMSLILICYIHLSSF
jgi:hypothetical protein